MGAKVRVRPEFWIAVQTNYRKEWFTAEQIGMKGFAETYVPEYFDTRRQRNKVLFEGFVFVRITDRTNWSPLLHTKGVRDVLRTGGNPSRMTPAQMREIRHVEKSGLLDEEWEYDLNDGVRIVGGAWIGHEGVFLHAKGHKSDSKMLVIGIELFGRMVPMDVMRSFVMPAQHDSHVRRWQFITGGN